MKPFTVLWFHVATLGRAVYVGVLTSVWFWRAAYTSPNSMKTMLVSHRDQLSRFIEGIHP